MRMRNITDIIKDDRNGKQLSRTERQIAVAYIQGKYDAVRELKIDNNSNINEVLDKIRVEIEQAEIVYDKSPDYKDNRTDAEKAADLWKMYKLLVLGIIDKYKAESEGKE